SILEILDKRYVNLDTVPHATLLSNRTLALLKN
ncbi:MAG: hypothetical protein H6Q07_203, partial [Acidobacteria bacterium]|nr:hypothetical protein [Acidobacteriota bacterium]